MRCCSAHPEGVTRFAPRARRIRTSASLRSFRLEDITMYDAVHCPSAALESRQRVQRARLSRCCAAYLRLLARLITVVLFPVEGADD
jgi:hypothetical protein